MSTKKKISEALKKEIGDRFRAFRKAKNLSMEVVATTLGVSDTAISNFETGKNIFGVDSLIILSKSYGLNIHELFTGEKHNTKESYTSKNNEQSNVNNEQSAEFWRNKVLNLELELKEKEKRIDYLEKEVSVLDRTVLKLEKLLTLEEKVQNGKLAKEKK